MTIIKQAQRNKYCSISNELAQNNNLSLRARGLMLYFLSLPENWQIHVCHLVKVMKEGKHIILDTLKELKKEGYVHHIKLGFAEGWSYVVFDHPASPEELKELLRTNGNSNRSENEQIANQQLQSTKNSSIKKDLLHKVKKDEEDFSQKRERKRASSFSQNVIARRIMTKWIMEDRPEKVVELVMKEFEAQPVGSIRSIKAWMDTVYAQKYDQHLGEELLEKRRHYAQATSEYKSNYFYCSKKDVLVYTNGSKEIEYSIKSNDDFWKQRGLGRESIQNLDEEIDDFGGI